MNWFKKAQQDFYIFGKNDDPDFINNKNMQQTTEAIKLKNGDIIYGRTSQKWNINHWELYLIAKKYIGMIKNIKSLGYLSPDGAYSEKISDINNIGNYLFGDDNR